MLHIVQGDGISQLTCRKHKIISIRLENNKYWQCDIAKLVWQPLEKSSLKASEACAC